MGVNGKVKQASGMCILSQNIINEKIFFALWFWYIFLFMVCGLQVVYRAVIIAIPGLRRSKIAYKLKSNHYNARLDRFIKEGNLGDWFLLNQIGKNVDGFFFEKFIEEVFSNWKPDNRNGCDDLELSERKSMLMNEDSKA